MPRVARGPYGLSRSVAARACLRSRVARARTQAAARSPIRPQWSLCPTMAGVRDGSVSRCACSLRERAKQLGRARRRRGFARRPLPAPLRREQGASGPRSRQSHARRSRERTGSFLHAVEMASRILPSTLKDVTLSAVLDDGGVLEGETKIASSTRPIREISLTPSQVHPAPGVIDAYATPPIRAKSIFRPRCAASISEIGISNT